MKCIKNLIKAAGGIAKFSRKYGIPYRTVQNWNNGERNPPSWLVGLILRVNDLEATTAPEKPI
jgi:hypothetical protein